MPSIPHLNPRPKRPEASSSYERDESERRKRESARTSNKLREKAMTDRPADDAAREIERLEARVRAES